MPTFTDDPVVSRNSKANPESNAGVYGESSLFNGVRGESSADHVPAVEGVQTNTTDTAGPGLKGSSKGTGVWGESQTWMGVYGRTDSTTGGAGVMGEATHGEGVRGMGHSPDHGAVVGTNDSAGQGVYGESSRGEGVRGMGHSPDHGAVVGTNDNAGQGVYGESSQGEGVRGVGHSRNHGAVVGTNDGGGAGVFGQGTPAGHFEGDLEVTGNITARDVVLAGGQDCAEEFDIAPSAGLEPGLVVVLDGDGALQPSRRAYDKRVAGVISGAGNYKPGIVLDRQPSSPHRGPVALIGKAYCNVDARYAPIEVGDLLTTSDTPGHAMKASDPVRAFGSVIGKALRPLPEGQGLVPILVALQ